MFTLKEMKLIIKMHRKSIKDPNHVFTVSDIMELGGYNKHNASNCIRKLEQYLVFDVNRMQKLLHPRIMYPALIASLGEEKARERLKKLKEQRKKFKTDHYSHKKRLKIKLSDEGQLIARIILKAGKLNVSMRDRREPSIKYKAAGIPLTKKELEEMKKIKI